MPSAVAIAVATDADDERMGERHPRPGIRDQGAVRREGDRRRRADMERAPDEPVGRIEHDEADDEHEQQIDDAVSARETPRRRSRHVSARHAAPVPGDGADEARHDLRRPHRYAPKMSVNCFFASGNCFATAGASTGNSLIVRGHTGRRRDARQERDVVLRDDQRLPVRREDEIHERLRGIEVLRPGNDARSAP